MRVTANLDDEEALGRLVGYVEHLKREATDSWDRLVLRSLTSPRGHRPGP